MKRLKLPGMSLCDRCKEREICEQRSRRVVSCLCGDMPGGKFFRLDRAEKRRLESERNKIIEEFLSKLKRTKRSQVLIGSRGGIIYRQLPQEQRAANSRHWKREAIGSEEWKKWCENCGAEFETVNESRLLCNDCHDEICGMLGVDYALGRFLRREIKDD